MSRQSSPPKARPLDWLTDTSYGGHERGDEFTFQEMHGEQLMRRAKLIEYVVAPKGDWVTCVEINSLGEVRGGVRSIRPDQIRKWWRRRKVQPTPKQKRTLCKDNRPAEG